MIFSQRFSSGTRGEPYRTHMPYNRKPALRHILASSILCSAFVSGYAQYDNGSVVGTIQDATGAALPDATVTILNLDTGLTQTTRTDKVGHYEAPSLRVGRYSFEATAPGFSHAVASNIAVQVGGRQRIDLQLNVGSNDTAIQVSDVALQVDTESSQRAQTVTNYQSAALPLVTRNYADLLGLVTGVRANTDAAPRANTATLTRSGSFSVNGLRSTLNNYLLDGVDNNSYSASNQGARSHHQRRHARRHQPLPRDRLRIHP